MRTIGFIAFLFLFISTLYCQQNDTAAFTPLYRNGIPYQFKTNIGTVFKGFVVAETHGFVTVENREFHEIYDLRKSEIVSSRIVSDRESFSNLVLGENHHARNYMLLGSAFLFREEKLSSSSHWLVLENLDYALTKHWALTMNTIAFYPLTIGVKCAYEISDENYIGGNVFFLGNASNNTYNTANTSFLWGYGAFGKYTRGNSNDNFTVSGGVLGLNSDILFNVNTTPFTTTFFTSAGYCRRVSKNVALNLEGWYLPESQLGIAGASVKLVGNETNSWSFGCFTLFNTYANVLNADFKVLPIPYIGVSRNF